jgi:5'-methylthioadenosine phosphorylase
MLASAMTTENKHPLALLAPAAVLPAAPARQHETPYGHVLVRQVDGVLCIDAAAPPHAQIYAARTLEVRRIIEVLPLYAVNRLLLPGDVLLPHDLLDLTHNRRSTFFVGKGYGFLPQYPPYCPVLRAALQQAVPPLLEPGSTTPPRLFARGTYAASEHSGSLDAQSSTALAAWGADALGSSGVPGSFLARELEMCYVPLGVVVAASPLCPQDIAQPRAARFELTALARLTAERLPQLAGQVRAHLPQERACVCAQAMQPTRARGLVGDDWRSWPG